MILYRWVSDFLFRVTAGSFRRSQEEYRLCSFEVVHSHLVVPSKLFEAVNKIILIVIKCF